MPDERTRVELKIPEATLNKITEYQQAEGISTRAAAVMELIRLGLKAANRDRD